MKSPSRMLEPSLTGWVLLLCVTAFLRLWRIHDLPPGLWMDEARNLSELSTFLETGRWDPGWICGQPVYALPATLTCALFGMTPLGLRLASVLVGILTIPAVYLFAQSMTSRRAAWIATWLVAVSPWHIIFSRIGFRAILLPLFIALCGWALARALARSTWWGWIGFGALCGLGWHTYFAFWLLPPLAFGVLLVWLRTPGVNPGATAGRRGVLLAVAVFLVLAGTWMWILHARTGAYISSRLREAQVVSDETEAMRLPKNVVKTALMFGVLGDKQPRHNVPGTPAWPLLLVPFLLVGMARAVSQPTPKRWALLALWVATLVPTVLSEECPHHLRALGNIIPTAIFTAEGLIFVADRLQAPIADAALALVLAGCTALGAWGYFGAYAHQPALRFAFQTKECALAYYLRDRIPVERPVVVLNVVYGRATVELLLRDRPHTAFFWWRAGGQIPDKLRYAPPETVWAVTEEDRVRVEALHGEPRQLAYFGPNDGAPAWMVVDFAR